MKEKVFVVIPAFNEEEHIAEVIDKTKKYVDNIIVVDDGSKDNTYEIAANKGIIALRHIVNLGKGSALKTGCDYALNNNADIMIVLDADTQHDPEEIPRFINTLKENNLDIVFGSRTRNKDMPFILRLGNWSINKTLNLLFNIKLSDTQSGYRAFTTEAYKKIRWDASDYSMESEMIANVGKKRLKYKEINIKTIYSDKYKGTTVMDGVKIVLNMVWWRLTK